MREYLTTRMAIGASLLSLVTGAFAQAPQFKLYNYPQDGFAASFPSQPDMQKKSLATPKGTFELRSYVSSEGDTSLFVSVCDYGPAAENTDPERLLLGAKNSALANSNAHLLNEKTIVFGPNHGLQFEAENGATHYTARYYIAGSTMYQTLVVSPLDKPFDQTAEFLDSFKLITKTPAVPAR